MYIITIILYTNNTILIYVSEIRHCGRRDNKYDIQMLCWAHNYILYMILNSNGINMHIRVYYTTIDSIGSRFSRDRNRINPMNMVVGRPDANNDDDITHERAPRSI